MLKKWSPRESYLGEHKATCGHLWVSPCPGRLLPCCAGCQGGREVSQPPWIPASLWTWPIEPCGAILAQKSLLQRMALLACHPELIVAEEGKEKWSCPACPWLCSWPLGGRSGRQLGLPIWLWGTRQNRTSLVGQVFVTALISLTQHALFVFLTKKFKMPLVLIVGQQCNS